jgi:hypothetical protein
MMTSSKPSASAEYWKEQFGFVSGTILITGIALLKIWPYVAMFQAEEQIHFWSRSPTPQPGVWLFHLLTGILALGMSSVFFSVLHILYRAIWLGLLPYRNETAFTRLIRNRLRTRANRAYTSTLIVWMLFAIYATILIAVGLSIGIYHSWSRELTPSTSAWIIKVALLIVSLLLFPPWFFIFGLWVEVRTRSPTAPPVVWSFLAVIRRMILPVVVVAVSYALALEMCYTVDLSLDKKLMSRSEVEYTEISVRLGGATSDMTNVIIELKDEYGKTIRHLDLLPLGNGLYVSYISSMELSGKLYRVVLTYPRYTFSYSYPFFTQKIERSASLVIVS